MKYMGSKNRHAKELLPIILANRKADQWYVEPFVGGFNMIDKVLGLRIASDINPYLISLFEAIQGGWEPPNIVSEGEYKEIRDNKGMYRKCLVAFVGFGCTYSGKWFGGYARGNDSKGNPRNYAAESQRNILAQASSIDGVHMTACPYWQLQIPRGSIVYCDPPYASATAYKDKFNHVVFWDWVRFISSHFGHEVFVSEYNAPGDFECLWEKRVNNTLVQNTGSKQGVERLFKLKGQTQ